MTDISQGDVLKISGFKNRFLVVSKNAFINSTGMFHVCPLIAGNIPGPVHIPVKLIREGTLYTVICEQSKLIDPNERGFGLIDRISYTDKMEVSDTIQGIYEYD